MHLLNACKLIEGETHCIIVPSNVTEAMAQGIVTSFLEAGGWNCQLHFKGDEPWIDFTSSANNQTVHD